LKLDPPREKSVMAEIAGSTPPQAESQAEARPPDWTSLLPLLTSFEGRIHRQLFWIGVLILAQIALVGKFLDLLIGEPVFGAHINDAILIVVFLYPAFAVSVKRGHDRDRPTWLIGICLVMVLLLLAVGYFGLLPSSEGAGGAYLRYSPWLLPGLVLLVDLGLLQGTPGANRYGADPIEAAAAVAAIPAWLITSLSVADALMVWEVFGRDINPVFGSYPSAIAQAFWTLARSGKLMAALADSLQPFAVGYALAIVIGVPLGLVIGRFRSLEAALGIYVTAGYAMPLVALVPLLVLWLGLGFKVKVAIIFLLSVFPICINTWLGVTAVPRTLIEVGKSFVAPDSVILRRIILPATLPYIMAGIRLAVGRAVVAMVIAEFFTSISGLGAIIITSANNFDTATTFVPIIVIMLMAVGLNFLIGVVERRVAPWQAEIAGRDQQ